MKHETNYEDNFSHLTVKKIIMAVNVGWENMTEGLKVSIQSRQVC